VTIIQGWLEGFDWGGLYDHWGLITLASNVSVRNLTVNNSGDVLMSNAVWGKNVDRCTIANVDVISSTARSNGFAHPLKIFYSSNIVVQNVNVLSESYGNITAIGMGGSNILLDTVTVVASSVNQYGVGGLWLRNAAIKVRNSTLDAGVANAGNYAIYDCCGDTVAAIANSELRGASSLRVDTPGNSAFLVNNTKVEGAMSTANIGTLKCFNAFGADYSPLSCP
jgi:hypothetical protein